MRDGNFENVIVIDVVRIKTMMLHYVREAVFELCDVVGVVTDDSFAQAKQKLTANFMHRSYAASWSSSTTITIAQL